MSADGSLQGGAERLLCEVFGSSRREGMYLYVARAEGLERVPEALREQFGEPRSVLTLLLSPERQLARVSGSRVLQAIAAQGYFLQMPPQPERPAPAPEGGE
jgi:uncharacterized protein YcgL (UPF0745 family)